MAKNIQNAFVVAGGLIEKDGKFLRVNAITGVPKGLWNIPAGMIDDGEAIDEAAVREVKEETGFDTAIEGVIGVYHRLKNKYAGNMIRVNFKMTIFLPALAGSALPASAKAKMKPKKALFAKALNLKRATGLSWHSCTAVSSSR